MRVTAYSEKLKSSLKQVYRFRLTISRGETKDRHTVKYDNFSFVEVIMPVISCITPTSRDKNPRLFFNILENLFLQEQN